MNNTDIPLPQDTQLYQVASGVIIEPRLSVLSLDYNCTAGSYSDIQNKQFLISLYSQNTDEMNLKIDDLNISSIRSAPYYSLNGFDYSFDYRFLNFSSPTVCFFPQFAATDLDTNVVLAAYPTLGANYYSISNYRAVLSNTLNTNDSILLRNQTTNAERKSYRVVSKNDTTLIVYDDSTINILLSQNQNYIFTRAKVVDSLGTAYYGLYNTGGYFWVSQTKGLQLQPADYGIYLTDELSSNQLNIAVFTAQSITPLVNQILAINVVTSGSGASIVAGGKTSGIYMITKIANSIVYFQPIYPPYVFIHQFIKVKYDFRTFTNAIWIVDASTVGNNNYLYNTAVFRFVIYDPTPISTTPSSWAQQVGGSKDSVLGFTLYSAIFNNNFIRHSDIFSITTKVPTWATNYVTGLALNTNYDTNILAVSEQAVVA
jgi:hypothetical protein